MTGGGVMVVDAAMLNDFRLFNRESIFQIRRSFQEPEKGKWSLTEVEQTLRAAGEPAQQRGNSSLPAASQTGVVKKSSGSFTTVYQNRASG